MIDPELHRLSTIVRAADSDAKGLAPETSELEAIAEGFRLAYSDDQELLEKQRPVCDALHASCIQRG
ncbi:MAG: chromate resistance protein ChrB domain-containing protein [Chloroflexota bacterium]